MLPLLVIQSNNIFKKQYIVFPSMNTPMEEKENSKIIMNIQFY